MKAHFLIYFLIFALADKKSPVIQIWTYPAKSVRVKDGDTISLGKRGKRIHIRLTYIDAPELSQFYGKRSRDFVEHFFREADRIKIVVTGRGYYGRYLGEVFVGEQSLNLLMLEKGMATIYPYSRYRNKKQKMNYQMALFKASRKKLGIWGAKKMLTPRYYRKNKKGRN